jgi:hypothetical protein
MTAVQQHILKATVTYEIALDKKSGGQYKQYALVDTSNNFFAFFIGVYFTRFM